MAKRLYTAEEVLQNLMLEANSNDDDSIDDIENEETYLSEVESDISDQEVSSSEESSDDIVDDSYTQSDIIVSRDGTNWNKHSPASFGRRGACNVLHERGGPTRFILPRVNTGNDIFLELFGRNNLEDILKYTEAESERCGLI